MDAAELQKSLERLSSWLSWAASWTPNKTDDVIAAAIAEAIKNPLVLNFLAFLLSQYKGKLGQLTHEEMLAAVEQFKSSQTA